MIAACMGQIGSLDGKERLCMSHCPSRGECYRHDLAQKVIHQHNPQQPWVQPAHFLGRCPNQLKRVYALVGEAA